MTNPRVQQATLADLGELAPLFDAYRRFYRKPPDLDAARGFLRDRFEHLDSAIFIARDAGRAIGFTQLYPQLSSTSLGRAYLLNDLFVAEPERGRGIGRLLLEAAEACARALGAVRLTLFTERSNRTAQQVYEAVGWKQDDVYFVYHRALAAGQVVG